MLGPLKMLKIGFNAFRAENVLVAGANLFGDPAVDPTNNEVPPLYFIFPLKFFRR